ncbi:MAG TPA: FtsX-like permease family protein [Opitutaceae bacterium]|jgi:putative ABC transport system permease protein|nr:FtsX-like permease family protein [Opitutaceae bacterium]
MTLALIILRSLRQHALSTLVTALSIALAGGLLMSVWAVKEQSQAVFTHMNSGFDAVLGARGSKLQLVLNAIFHLEASPGNISAADYEFIKRHPAVKRAIPIAVGDNLRGYRIVGTIPELFTDVEYAAGKKFSLSAGRLFDPAEKEAVIGSFVAQELGLGVGDTFHPFHGLIYDERDQHAETYHVTGVLAASNTPIDKVIWIPLHGLQTMSGHDPRAATDVSAVLVQLRSPAAGFMLDLMYNKQGDRLTFAYPIAAIMAGLFQKISWFDQVLSLIAYLVALVSAAGVLVAIYNSMAARRRDIAILRALGAHRRTVCSAIVLEAAAIGALGMIAAFAVYAGIFTIVAAVIRAQTGVMLEPFAYNRVMLWAPLGMIALCALSGLLPAWKAYRTDIAGNLAPLS